MTLRSICLFAFSAVALAEENTIKLQDAPGKRLIETHCRSCHSLDYIEMNGGILDAAGWEKSVNKMIGVMGAIIPPGEVPGIVTYLHQSYAKARE
ncbi:MAG: c-type cytochrome [Gammaproteobacteria bacterium]